MSRQIQDQWHCSEALSPQWGKTNCFAKKKLCFLGNQFEIQKNKKIVPRYRYKEATGEISLT